MPWAAVSHVPLVLRSLPHPISSLEVGAHTPRTAGAWRSLSASSVLRAICSGCSSMSCGIYAHWPAIAQKCRKSAAAAPKIEANRKGGGAEAGLGHQRCRPPRTSAVVCGCLTDCATQTLGHIDRGRLLCDGKTRLFVAWTAADERGLSASQPFALATDA
eukprot:scaffold117435_cov71-Phaeocystis_antarctica.AAC.3